VNVYFMYFNISLIDNGTMVCVGHQISDLVVLREAICSTNATWLAGDGDCHHSASFSQSGGRTGDGSDMQATIITPTHVLPRRPQCQPSPAASKRGQASLRPSMQTSCGALLLTTVLLLSFPKLWVQAGDFGPVSEQRNVQACQGPPRLQPAGPKGRDLSLQAVRPTHQQLPHPSK
jgi:hypothetical protein